MKRVIKWRMKRVIKWIIWTPCAYDASAPHYQVTVGQCSDVVKIQNVRNGCSQISSKDYWYAQLLFKIHLLLKINKHILYIFWFYLEGLSNWTCPWFYCALLLSRSCLLWTENWYCCFNIDQIPVGNQSLSNLLVGEILFC